MSILDILFRHMFNLYDEKEICENKSDSKESYNNDIEKCLWEIKDDLNLTTEEIETAMKDNNRREK
tara:strand:+ start:2142 stop:2339 length:198 start_codon:yes stop_codon:yes gene_type:complete